MSNKPVTIQPNGILKNSYFSALKNNRNDYSVWSFDGHYIDINNNDNKETLLMVFGSNTTYIRVFKCEYYKIYGFNDYNDQKWEFMELNYGQNGNNIPCVSLSPNNQYIGTVSIDTGLRVWKLDKDMLKDDCKTELDLGSPIIYLCMGYPTPLNEIHWLWHIKWFDLNTIPVSRSEITIDNDSNDDNYSRTKKLVQNGVNAILKGAKSLQFGKVIFKQ